MNKIYNEEIKEKFLKTYENEQTQKTIRNVFLNSEIIEDTLDKDLCNFNLTEIGKVIKNANPHNITVAKSIGRFITQYISWASEHGYRMSNDNPMKGIDLSWYNDLVDKTKKIHYSEEEFNELLGKMMNAQDQLFLRLIYEGVSQNELRELKVSDINWDNNTITVSEEGIERTVELTDKCMEYIEKAFNQKTYFVYNKDTKEHKEKELLESQYIFRNVKSPRSQENVPLLPSVIYKRLSDLKAEFELEYLTPNAIRQSGMIKMAADLYKEFGKLDYDQFEIIGDRYKASKIISNNYEYYNTTLMKEYITEDNLQELYNINIKF